MYNFDHTLAIEGENAPSFGPESPGYYMSGQLTFNASAANAVTMQTMLSNFYNSSFGPAATNMEDYFVLFNGTAADPNLSSPPAMASFNGLAYGAFGIPDGFYQIPDADSGFNAVVTDDLALQQAYGFFESAGQFVDDCL